MEVILNDKQKKIIKQFQSSKFTLGLLGQLPMGLLAGLRVKHLDTETCVTTVPYKWLNKNPFRSMYFAVQSMAAELSTATHCLLACAGQSPSVAFIIVDMKANFSKKATAKVSFTCTEGFKAHEAIEKCKNTGQPQKATLKTAGTMPDGTVVSEFEFTWSFKQRSS